MPDIEAEYVSYRKRADQLLAGVALGGYGKYCGRLVKRLDQEEFAARWQEYLQVREAYDRTLSRGDTVNDAIVQLLNEQAAELLLET